jgi:hypothetical protein
MRAPNALLACLAWSSAVCSSGPIGHIVSRNVPNSVGSWVWAKRPGHVVTPSVRSLRRSCLFFGNVNQVLVRLWARVTQGVSVVLGSWMDRRSRCSADLSDRELLFVGLDVLHPGGGWRPNGWAARVQRRDERSERMDLSHGCASSKGNGHPGTIVLCCGKHIYFQRPSFIP